MSCRHRDEELLLLVHHELHGVRRLLTLAHLYRCPRCQERRQQFAGVSTLLADALSTGGAARRLPQLRIPALPAPRPRWSLALSLALLLATTVAAAVFGIPGTGFGGVVELVEARAGAPSCSPAPPIPSGACLPGAPGVPHLPGGEPSGLSRTPLVPTRR